MAFLEDELTREELALGSLLYKLQLGCTHNVHLIYRLAGDVSGGIPLDMVGSAVYQNCVLLNHSCAANTTRLFQVPYFISLKAVYMSHHLMSGNATLFFATGPWIIIGMT